MDHKQKGKAKPIIWIVDILAAVLGVAVVSLEVLRFTGLVNNLGIFSALGMVALLVYLCCKLWKSNRTLGIFCLVGAILRLISEAAQWFLG